ncbi:L-shaped tail fiber protein assembly [Vibrio phage D51]
MSYLDNKTLDIVLEENSDFGFKLTFTEVNTVCDSHPVSGEDTNCREVSAPLDVSGLTFYGNISPSLDDGASVLAAFSFSVLGAASGFIEMTLDQATVNSLSANRPNLPDSQRKRQIGYYDVISVDPNSNTTTRILQGKVYVSDGVTT